MLFLSTKVQLGDSLAVCQWWIWGLLGRILPGGPNYAQFFKICMVISLESSIKKNWPFLYIMGLFEISFGICVKFRW